MDGPVNETEVSSSVALSPEVTERILHDYETILAKSAPPLGCVADTGELPHSKQLIKDAIIASMTTHPRKDKLRMAYLTLADWQEGVGDQHLELTLLKPTVRGSIRAQAPACDADMDRWNIKVVDERQALARELKTMGFGLI